MAVFPFGREAETIGAVAVRIPASIWVWQAATAQWGSTVPGHPSAASFMPRARLPGWMLWQTAPSSFIATATAPITPCIGTVMLQARRAGVVPSSPRHRSTADWTTSVCGCMCMSRPPRICMFPGQAIRTSIWRRASHGRICWGIFLRIFGSDIPSQSLAVRESFPMTQTMRPTVQRPVEPIGWNSPRPMTPIR